ncbi:flavin reductase [Polycladidibacter stylochi]|uniref:flavin reductase n=1 Tax=Polycladidibacter stylochi TaxID=1807766 RepID=UPI000B29204C|nr:flavin reductase [Pseudovibrio stylochi]
MTNTAARTRNQKPENVEDCVSQHDFREAMSRFGAAVHVLATNGPAGKAGATVTAVTSVTDAPPTILVCLNRQSQVNQTIKRNGCFTLNTLCEQHEELSNAFAGAGKLPIDERYAKGTWCQLAGEQHHLQDARVSLQCQISEVTEVGTHSVIFARVTRILLGDEAASALIYMDRGYKSL